MVCKIACKQCSQTGLPILFTRYGAAYSSTKDGMAALASLRLTGRLQAKPGSVDMQLAKYNLRMLRAGYLYIRVESTCRMPEWFGYVVHPHGYLTKIDIKYPEKTENLAACSPGEWGANRSLVWIKDVKAVTKLNYMFHPDPINPVHLETVIEKEPDKYMQRFNVSGWAGDSKTGPDTAVPSKDASQWPVAEFRALTDEKLRNALEPQLHGLMGSSVMERCWGDYEDKRVVEIDSYMVTGEYAGKTSVEQTSIIKQLDYADAHGKRLQNIARYLDENGGAIVACEDAIGIAQELGHLQAEAQTGYTRWQVQDAQGAAKGVSNEWVYQTAVAAQSLQGLIKKGAVERVERHIARWNKMLDERAENDAMIAHGNPEVLARNAENRAIARANQERERGAATTVGDEVYKKYFDEGGAKEIFDTQSNAFKENSARLSQLGLDHVAWLKSPGLMQAIKRYSTQSNLINKSGGGGALTVQIAQCMAGTEGNSTGQEWIERTDLFGDNPLGCAISFNNMKLQRALQEMFNATLPTSLPGEEPSTERFDNLVDLVLKPTAADIALADKAIEFASDSKLRPISQSALMRKLAWPLHLASLFSVKMMQAVKNRPAFEAEAKLVKFVALTGFVNMGKTAGAYAKTLSKADADRLRNAQRAIERAARRDGVAMAREGAPHARAAAMAGVFDVANALIKGYQLSVKKDARTGVEMVGSLMQATGSLLDWRAKAYEVSVFEGATGVNIFTATSQHAVSDTVNALRLRGMRMTAFRFLLPAAIVGIYWDASDALQSRDRGDKWLARIQWASVAGAAFSVTATGMAATGALFGISSATWAMTACILGLLGAVVAVIAVVAIIFLKDEPWMDWLKDNPLNKNRKGKKPLHENLMQTLQKLANAQASAA
jgi:hypothetical protein